MPPKKARLTQESAGVDDPRSMRGQTALTSVSRSTQPPAIPRQPGTTSPCELSDDDMHDAVDASRYLDTRMCLNAIERRLMARSAIVAMRGVERMIPTRQFDDYLHNWMLPFARDAFLSIQRFGIVPVAFTTTETGDVAGYVPTWPAWTATVHAERGRPVYRFYWRADTASGSGSARRIGQTGEFGSLLGRYDANVHIVGDWGVNPALDGHLTSNMATVVPAVALAQELLASSRNAETVLSDPPLYLQRDFSLDRAEASTYEHGMYSGSQDEATTRKEELEFTRSAGEQQQYRRLLSAYQGITKTRHASDRRPAGDSSSLRSRIDETGRRQVLLPSSRQVATVPLPVRNTQLTQTLEHVQRLICGALNVPRDVLANDSAARASSEVTSETMTATVQETASQLSRLMTMVYEHAFGLRDFREALRAHARRNAADPARAMATERDFFQAHEETRVTLAFDLAPTVPPERLDYANARGMIEWSAYVDRSLAQMGIPRQLGRARDPLTRDERVALLGGARPKSEGDAKSTSSTKDSSKSSSSSSSGSGEKRKRTGSDADK